jgi:hypothetical protein
MKSSSRRRSSKGYVVRRETIHHNPTKVVKHKDYHIDKGNNQDERRFIPISTQLQSSIIVE